MELGGLAFDGEVEFGLVGGEGCRLGNREHVLRGRGHISIGLNNSLHCDGDALLICYRPAAAEGDFSVVHRWVGSDLFRVHRDNECIMIRIQLDVHVGAGIGNASFIVNPIFTALI